MGKTRFMLPSTQCRYDAAWEEAETATKAADAEQNKARAELLRRDASRLWSKIVRETETSLRNEELAALKAGEVISPPTPRPAGRSEWTERKLVRVEGVLVLVCTIWCEKMRTGYRPQKRQGVGGGGAYGHQQYEYEVQVPVLVGTGEWYEYQSWATDSVAQMTKEELEVVAANS